MAILRKEMLVKTSVDGNNNKAWSIELHDDFTLHVWNGRIGTKGIQQDPIPCHSEAKAIRTLETKMRAKLRDDYQVFTGTSTNSAPSPSLGRMALEMAASQQIRTNSQDVVSELIKRLVQANIHSILANTELKYDESSGVFQTPLGIVTKDSINDARTLLNKISKHINGQDFTSPEIKALLASYLMLIPQKVGRKVDVQALLPNDEAIQKQSGILDDLESSIEQVAQLKVQKGQEEQKVPEIEKIFSCEIDIEDDQSVLTEIERFYRSTEQAIHESYGYRIKRVFKVKIDDMDAAYVNDGSKIGNVSMLWHGSRPGNLLSILKSGLMIPKSSAGHVCGRNFGDGVYFSDQSTKSLNYATGYWAGAKEDQCFMFLADVAMGKAYIPESSAESLPKAGYDSTFAKGGHTCFGKAGRVYSDRLRNNEMIVYQTSRARLRYLVEFVR
jgi:poly [ADP-ribose] polymerase